MHALNFFKLHQTAERLFIYILFIYSVLIFATSLLCSVGVGVNNLPTNPPHPRHPLPSPLLPSENHFPNGSCNVALPTRYASGIVMDFHCDSYPDFVLYRVCFLPGGRAFLSCPSHLIVSPRYQAQRELGASWPFASLGGHLGGRPSELGCSYLYQARRPGEAGRTTAVGRRKISLPFISAWEQKRAG